MKRVRFDPVVNRHFYKPRYRNLEGVNMLGTSENILDYVMSLPYNTRQDVVNYYKSWFFRTYNISLSSCIQQTNPNGKNVIQEYIHGRTEIYELENKKILDYEQKLEMYGDDDIAIKDQIKILRQRLPELKPPSYFTIINTFV